MGNLFPIKNESVVFVKCRLSNEHHTFTTYKLKHVKNNREEKLARSYKRVMSFKSYKNLLFDKIMTVWTNKDV